MSVARIAKSAIKIPRRIERGPTDILKALSSTIRYLPDQPEPRLADDPFLLPDNANAAKNLVAAKLSGVKAAKFFLDKYPEIFYRDDAEPKIAAFMPTEEFKPEMDFTEEDLKWTIDQIDPNNAEIAYSALHEKGIKITDETVMQLFEMLCYTNGKPIIDLIDLQVTTLMGQTDTLITLWDKSGLASKIFDQIKDKLDPSRVYSAMIAGLTKYNEHAVAFELFDKYQETHPDSGLFPQAYSGLIHSIRKVHNSTESSEKALDGIVRHMGNNLVAPDLITLNAIIHHYCGRADEKNCQQAFKIFNDMEVLGIEPSLVSYADLMHLVLKSRSQSVDKIANGILDKVKVACKSATIRDPRDTQALEIIMRNITGIAKNLKLADRVFDIYLMRPTLVSDVRYRTRFYQNYFRLMVTTGTVEKAVKFYEENVPHNYIPHSEIYGLFADMLDLYQAPKELILRIGLDYLKHKPLDQVKDDEIFRKYPEYVAAYEELMDRPQRIRE